MIKGTKIKVQETEAVLNQKVKLATRAVDSLMFGGDIGKSLAPLAAMMGLSQLSIGLIFPTKNKDNVKPFLASVNLIISTALDDLVDLPEYTEKLAIAIQTIQQIAKAERG